MKSQSDFSTRALAHLSQYKVRILKIAEPGIYRYDGRNIPKAHILPKNLEALNLLRLVRPHFDKLLDTRNRRIKRHRYFHHLNSSQALAINLFQPFLTTPGRLATLADVLRLKPPLIQAGFEHVPDKIEGTNVDFFAEGADRCTLLIEVKFTERGFGTARNDDKHQTKFRTIYWPLLRKATDLREADLKEFFAAYQFFRNAVRAGQKANALTRVWFVVPRHHTVIWRAAEEYSRRLKSEIAAQVRVVALEDLLKELKSAVDDPELAQHLAEFEQKYVIPNK